MLRHTFPWPFNDYGGFLLLTFYMAFATSSSGRVLVVTTHLLSSLSECHNEFMFLTLKVVQSGVWLCALIGQGVPLLPQY